MMPSFVMPSFMMRSLMGRSAPSLLDQLLLRRRAPTGAESGPSDEGYGRARVTLAEMMVAATVLDFGGLPFELPAIRDAWPIDHEHSN
jgi:hypothetical protein